MTQSQNNESCNTTINELIYHTNYECGPHCGVKDKYIGHCEGCHKGECEASIYDRDKVKPFL